MHFLKCEMIGGLGMSETKPKKMVRGSFAIVLGLTCIILAASLVAAVLGLQNQVGDLKGTLNVGKSLASLDNKTKLIVWAWSDASYSYGSDTWMFYYEPTWGVSHESYLTFLFPFFFINPRQQEMISGHPILDSALSVAGQNGIEGRYLNATAGASYAWSGMEITVPIANPYYVVLVFEPIPVPFT
jgi:hypothetical protein